jgi:hypothetical protein
MMMQQVGAPMTEAEQRFVAAQSAVEDLQKQVALQQFELLWIVSNDIVRRPLTFNFAVGSFLPNQSPLR